MGGNVLAPRAAAAPPESVRDQGGAVVEYILDSGGRVVRSRVLQAATSPR